MLEQQGMLASRISELNKQQDSLQEQPDISKITELREAYRDVGRDLLKLLFFVERNAIGLQKILKKFDKPFGYRSTDYYVKTALIIRIPNSSKFSSMWKISVVVTHGYLVVTEQQVPEGVLKGINFSILSETDAIPLWGFQI
ncbi:SPX domain-containing membrane protein At1g63010 isoform X2 [Capsicum annuum]|uniref:SPX domain-containing membrane protein At1g63010 isoform X2 n=1 Tax=Capsicum annuum TaxID=4072 RepID=UPI0007BF3A21|nr:SPX domain-containing membrane protein At1g63010 isoform X2 [Capsicum annuum]